MSFYDWQQRFATEQACLDAIAAQRWPEGFRCPHCGHDHGWLYAARHRYECARCCRQTSITSGTAFHGSRVPLAKWFWTLYLVSADKGGLSALRLSKIIGVQWRTAYTMLRTLRAAMAARDRLYRLTELVEVDDAYIGANKTGKARRGGGRTPVLVAIEKTDEGKPGFVAIEVLDSLTKAQIIDFAQRRLSHRCLRVVIRVGRAGHPHRQDHAARGGRPVAALGPHRHRQPQAFSARHLPWRGATTSLAGVHR